MTFFSFRAKNGLDKTNNVCEIWHSEINSDLKVQDKYKHFYHIINILKAESERQRGRQIDWNIGSLAEPSKKSQDKYDELSKAVQRYGKLNGDALKLGWLVDITAKIDIDLEPDEDSDDEEEEEQEAEAQEAEAQGENSEN